MTRVTRVARAVRQEQFLVERTAAQLEAKLRLLCEGSYSLILAIGLEVGSIRACIPVKQVCRIACLRLPDEAVHM